MKIKGNVWLLTRTITFSVVLFFFGTVFFIAGGIAYQGSIFAGICAYIISFVCGVTATTSIISTSLIIMETSLSEIIKGGK